MNQVGKVLSQIVFIPKTTLLLNFHNECTTLGLLQPLDLILTENLYVFLLKVFVLIRKNRN